MKPFLLSGMLIAAAAPAFSDCGANGTQIFYCDTENASRVQVCLHDETVQFLGGPDLADPVYDLSMPVRFMPYLSTGIAQSEEDFSYIRFYEGRRVFTVGVDRDLELASVSLGLAHDFLPSNEEACNPNTIVDQFQVLDQFARSIGRVAPVVSVPEVSPDCGAVLALGPAEWMQDKEVSPIHLGPEEATTEVVPVDQNVRVCGEPVDGWQGVRFEAYGFECDLNAPDAIGAVCSSGFVRLSQLPEISEQALALSRPQALACQAGGFRFAMVHADNGTITIENEQLRLTLPPGSGPQTTTDTGSEQVMRLNAKLTLSLSHETLELNVSHSEQGQHSGNCVPIDLGEISK
ncbi:hypothetical protein [Phaeobacter gallaeciensis]|uniref:hypothetical protein n=1 Tax=Phaeobacter gallaeciensis TaxID=60890 RepID=UPI00237F6BF7|nr:hypothetical protein [Phaeobacter gallaeciensis]MEE2818343.1 hypothetical protein [Pseudomonadota bacterium]MDE4140678.1 hypothetical protein [Phaeobacter gallaeciensis]MDE4149123.1 hypothetical protein [Phaeobacter gallaeciensis]MDE4153684.1 hypothetical protein [Phaeobacter gallaeciensis]MDE4193019.1 hypothetical protein [Phaeobacter gallaeciensis]